MKALRIITEDAMKTERDKDVRRMTLLLMALILAGCSTGVVSIAPDTYMVGSSGNNSQAGAKADVYREASEYCSQQGKHLNEVKITSRGGYPFVPASAELHFRCVAPPPK